MSPPPRDENGGVNDLLPEKLAIFDVLIRHYAEQFTYHAGQRLSTFQFFLSAFGLLAAAFTALLTAKDGILSDAANAAPFVAIAAYLLSLAFGRLDRRNAQIIGTNEKPLARLQNVIANSLDGSDIWRTFDSCETLAQRLTTFGKLIPLVFLICAWMSVAGFIATTESAGWATAGLNMFAGCYLFVLALGTLYWDFPLKSKSAKRCRDPNCSAP